MPARGRPPKRNGKGGSGGNAGGSSTAGGGKKASGGSSGSGGITHRARDKTRGQGARLYNDPFNDERQLEAQLKRLGLYAANTLGDGSCLFRSLSDQLHGTPNHHLTIRHEVCNFLLAHRDEFIAFIDDSHHSSQESAFASHVAEMRNSATYGTQLEIVAFARMVTRKIKVIQAELVYVIGFEDESPSARAAREEAALAKRKDGNSSSLGGKGKMKEELPDLYIVYHNWEHYSSARNIAGPHTGLPCIVEAQQPMPGADPTITAEDISKATQEESLILSSLRYPHRHTITEIRKLIHDSSGSWEKALESLLENEIDETESEDFNHNHNHQTSSHSDNNLQSPLTTSTSINDDDDDEEGGNSALSPPSIGITAATPAIINSQLPSSHHHHHHRHHQQHNDNQARSSSPSASSSTTTSAATNGSQSTTATQLSDLVERDRKISTTSSNKTKSSTTTRTSKSKSSSISPSTTATHTNNLPASGAGGLASHLLLNGNTYNGSGSSSKVRSRAASPDAEFEAAESPRQRFRLSTSVDTNDDRASSYNGSTGGGDNITQDGASTPGSASSADGQSAMNDDTASSINEDENNSRKMTSSNPAPPTPSSSRGNTPNIISPVKSSRFPKRRDSLVASVRGPTRRQRKQAAKSGTPLGVQTRSKVTTANQESGLQREFKELYV